MNTCGNLMLKHTRFLFFLESKVSYKMQLSLKSSRVVLLAAFVVASCRALNPDCPEPEDIFPCYCEEEEGQSELVCNHFSQPHQIYDAVRGLKGHKVFKMSFFMNRILEPVKPEAFKDLAIERIVFENSTISLSPPQFQGAEDHLQSIQLRACFNQTNPLGSWSLAHLTKLKELTLDKNRLMSVPDDFLESVPSSLKTLALEENSIVTLGDHVFAKIDHLTFLFLDGNRLTALKRTMFPSPAENLRSLSLNNNRLRYLPYDLFTDMPNLRILEMTNNRLTNLDETIWSTMWSQLTKLDLSENALECDYSMKWMFADQSKPFLLYGECQSPENLKGKSLKSIKITDFN